MGKHVGCVVMAAGLSSRYGANKLLERLEGRSLIERTLEAVPLEAFSAAAVVAWHPEILGLAARRGFLAVENDRPQDGASRTVRLGLEAVGRCDGALFLVADQPRLRRGSILAVLRRWEEDPARIVGLGCGGKRGNPCLFPSALFPELMALEGDRGGSAVIRRHEALLTLVEAPAEELMDVDVPEALEKLRETT